MDAHLTNSSQDRLERTDSTLRILMRSYKATAELRQPLFHHSTGKREQNIV